MNGLLVTLPLLLLLFSSLYTSHAPILVLKNRACAIRVSLHSWVLNYSRESGNHKRRHQEDCSLHQNWTSVEDGRETLTPAGCITGLSVWFSVSDQLCPAVGESQNSQNAMLPTQSESASWELGGYLAVCDVLAEKRCLGLINRGRVLAETVQWQLCVSLFWLILFKNKQLLWGKMTSCSVKLINSLLTAMGGIFQQ